MNAQTFTIMVSKSPFDYRNAESALRFCEAAINQGHKITQVFFYASGVQNASWLICSNSDEVNMYKQWCKFHSKYAVPLHVCVTAAARRGVVNSQLVEEPVHANLRAPFQQVGLTEYFASIANGDTSIQL